jgi:hypothetical protein
MSQYALGTGPAAVHHRPPATRRRVTHGLATLVQLAMLYAVNWQPGWRSVGFLTSDADQVVWLFNLALAVGVAFNLAYLLTDPAWLTTLGDVVSAGFALAVFVRIWNVFPFRFTDTTIDWALFLRFGLGLAIAGAVVGLFVGCVSLLTEALR